MRNINNGDLDALIEAAPLGIVVFDKNAVITRWNPAMERIFGWKESEVTGKAYNPVLPESDDSVHKLMREKLLSGGSLNGEECLRKRKDGKFINVKTHSSLLKDISGNITGVIGIYDDITEEKKEHEKLIWNELMLREMAESSRSGFYLVDSRDDKILYYNKKFIELWDLAEIEPVKDLSNSGLMNICSEKVEHKEKFVSSLKLLMNIDNQAVYEDEIIFRDGRIFSYYTTPLIDDNRNYLGRFFMFEDKTESKLFEALLISENEYTRSVGSSIDAIILADNSGKVLMVNKSAETLLKVKADKLLNTKMHDFLQVDDFLTASILTYGRTETILREIKDINGETRNLEFHIRLHSHNKIQISVYDAGKQVNKSRSQSNFEALQSRFIFTSDEMKKLNYEITRLANLDFDVLIEGETGVGKDLVASQIHSRSSRKNNIFLPVSISSLSESLIESELFGHEKGAFSGADRQIIGKFEAADKGILYIPEISSLPESIQLKLLHFMQYKSITRVGQDARKGEVNIDVRLIMATNENLEKLVSSGRLRKDFYYRISGTSLTIPPLRKRKDDIISIAEYYLGKFKTGFPGKHFEFSDEAKNMLREYPWHGNVRELVSCVKNVISFNTESVLEPHHFRYLLRKHDEDTDINNPGNEIDYITAENDFKKNYFKKLLNTSNNRISEAAKSAGMTPQGLRKALKKLGM